MTNILLTAGVYFWTNDYHMGPFGLYMAQKPEETILPYAVWYNQNGEQLGWGHLTKKNIKDIRLYLPEDEKFLIVNWATLERDRKQGLSTEKLSVARLSQSATVVIEQRQIYQKGPFDDLEFELAYGLLSKSISTQSLANKLLKLEGAIVL